MATRHQTRKCCSGKFCTNPKLQLSAAHSCPDCKGIVHVPCVVFDEKQDLYWCKLCASKKPVNPSEEKKCKACGGTDHLHKTSHKCPLNPVNASLAKRVGKKPKALKRREDTTGTAATKNEAVTAKKKISLSEPDYLHVDVVKKGDKKYSPVVDVTSESFVKRKTTFRITKKDPFTNQNQVVVPDPNVLLDHFLPLSIINHVVNSSNHYCKGRKESFPDL
eukprot:14135435-Ditylum_brightwellii.AAC.1